MQHKIQFTVIRDHNAKGQIADGARFSTRQLFIYLIRHFGLSEEAKKSNVEIALDVDVAPLDDKTGHVTIGFKICGKMIIDPITGLKIFNQDKDGPNMKSVKICFACGLFLTKEEKITYHKYLRNIFVNIKTCIRKECPSSGGCILMWLSRKI
jgi:hypothetical protein